MVQPYAGIKAASFYCKEMNMQNIHIFIYFICSSLQEIFANSAGDVSSICLEHPVGKN